MATLQPPVADAADAPAPVGTTAAALIQKLAADPAFLPSLSPSTQSQLTTLAATPSPAHLISAIPTTPQSPHRLQLSIRGQRFEMAVETALEYFIAAFAFFGLPVDTGVVEAAAAPRRMQDLCMMASLSAETIGSLSLAHYRHSVAPFLTELVQAMGGTGAVGLPPLAVPVEIIWEPTRTHWQFIFAKRLPEKVAEAERHRLDMRQRQQQQQQGQQQGQGQASGTAEAPRDARAYGQIYALDPHDNPFLLLQPHFMGIVVVLARRAAKLRAESAATAATNPHDVASPAFPARWNELDYDAQLSLAQLVRTLGVSLLLAKFAVPTAAVDTSDYRPDATDAKEKATEADAPALEEAGEEAKPKQVETASDTAVVDAAWVRRGCAACGMSGHATESCPYVTKA